MEGYPHDQRQIRRAKRWRTIHNYAEAIVFCLCLAAIVFALMEGTK